MDTDVDRIDIKEDKLSNSEDAIADSDDDDDAGIFSIANDSSREDYDTLAEEEKDLLALSLRRTDKNKGESAGEFLLVREAVVRFVQDYIANAVDRAETEH